MKQNIAFFSARQHILRAQFISALFVQFLLSECVYLFDGRLSVTIAYCSKIFYLPVPVAPKFYFSVANRRYEIRTGLPLTEPGGFLKCR